MLLPEPTVNELEEDTRLAYPCVSDDYELEDERSRFLLCCFHYESMLNIIILFFWQNPH